MTGGTGAVKNIPYNTETGLVLPREVQLQRMKRVMAQELTEIQRQILTLYYFENKRPAEIARIRGVHRSTVLRTLHRAENRLRRFLQY